jgi:hypothetical protein
MSAIGTKRTYQVAPHMSAFGGKADIRLVVSQCPLLTQSGHAMRHISVSQYRVPYVTMLIVL